jgi:hypothetical protein
MRIIELIPPGPRLCVGEPLSLGKTVTLKSYARYILRS